MMDYSMKYRLARLVGEVFNLPTVQVMEWKDNNLLYAHGYAMAIRLGGL